MKYQVLYEYRTGVNSGYAISSECFDTLEDARKFRPPRLVHYKQIKNTETEEVIEKAGECFGSIRF